MAPVKTSMGLLALASAALATPYHGYQHKHYHHHSGKASGGAPYSFSNGTFVVGPTGTGTAPGTGAATVHRTQTVTSYVSVVPVAASAASADNDVAVAQTTTSCDSTYTSTYINTNTVYVTASTNASGSVVEAVSTSASSPSSSSNATSSPFYPSVVSSATSSSGSLTFTPVVKHVHFTHKAHSSSETSSSEVAAASTSVASSSSLAAYSTSSSSLAASSTTSSSSLVAYSTSTSSLAAPSTSSSSLVAYTTSAASSSVVSSSSTTSSSASTTSSASSSLLAAGTPFKTKRGCGFNYENYELCNSFSSGDVAWAYDWEHTSWGSLTSGAVFVPTMHDLGDTSTGTLDWFEQVDEAITAGAPAVFTWNEPDISGGGGVDISPSTAADNFDTYFGNLTNVLVGSPSVSDSTGAGVGLNWTVDFLTACADANMACKFDFLNMHLHVTLSDYGTVDAAVEYFQTRVNRAQSFFPDYPIYITELSLDGTTDANVESYLAAIIPWLEAEEQSFVHAYVYQPANMVTGAPLISDGSATSVGDVYCTTS